MSRRAEILAAIQKVEALPPGGAELIRLLQEPQPEIERVRRAIEYDPQMTSNVLRLANSALYAGARTVDSIHQAALRLGLVQLGRLAMTSLVAPLASQAVQGYDLPPGELLRHSLFVALGTQELITTLQLPASTGTFTAGLLADIGKVVLGTFVAVDTQPIQALARQEGIPFDEAERRVLGLDHAEAGARLLRQWQLPETIVQAVRWHHQPGQAVGERTAVYLVHIADEWALQCGIGAGSDGLRYRLQIPEELAKQLTSSVYQRCLSRILGRMEDLGAAVGGGRSGPC